MSGALLKAIRSELPWVMAAQAISFIGGFAIVKLLALALGAEGFGYYSLCLSVAAMISLLWHGPLDQIILRYYSDIHEKREQLFHLAIRGHLFVIALLLLATFCLLGIVFSIGDADHMLQMIILAMLLSIPKGMFGSTLSFYNALRNRRALFNMQTLDILSRLALVGLFNMVGLTASLAIELTMVSALLPVLCSVASKQKIQAIFTETGKSFKYFSGNDNILNDKKYIHYGRSFILIGILAALCNYADRWIILHNLTLTDVGIYSGIAQIATAPLIAITTISTQFLGPIMFNSGAGSKLNQAWIYLTLASIYGAITLLFFAFSDKIVRVLLTPEFLTYHRILPALSLGLSFFYLAQIYFIKAQKNERPHVIKPAWLVRTILMVTLGILLTQKIGIWGLAIATITSSAAFLIILIISI